MIMDYMTYQATHPDLPSVQVTVAGYLREYDRRGGWCAFILRAKVEKQLCGWQDRGSLGRMEVTALSEAFSALTEPCEVTVKTFSEYLHECASRILRPSRSDTWLSRCNSNNVPNSDLWLKFAAAAAQHRVRLQWVPLRTKDFDARRCVGEASAAARFRRDERTGICSTYRRQCASDGLPLWR